MRSLLQVFSFVFYYLFLSPPPPLLLFKSHMTGLILARMCTLENETRTVLELWEERSKEETQKYLNRFLGGTGGRERKKKKRTLTLVSGCESPRAGHYTGYKKFKEGGGEGNILRILTEVIFFIYLFLLFFLWDLPFFLFFKGYQHATTWKAKDFDHRRARKSAFLSFFFFF